MKKLILLCLLSALLAIISWPPFGPCFFIFFFLLPLFFIESKAQKKEIKSWHFLALTFFSFFIFYLYTSRWLIEFNKSIGISVQFLNALFPTFTFAIFHLLKKKLPNRNQIVHIVFVLLWLSIEIFQFNREIGFPHLILGNVFGMMPTVIQWYELTGVIGGSCWTLIVNIFLYQLAERLKQNKPIMQMGGLLVLSLLLPLSLSFYLLKTLRISGEEINVTALHSNIKSNAKVKITKEEFLDICVLETRKALEAKKTDYVLWPEGAFNGGWMESLNVNTISKRFADFPKIQFAVGATLFKQKEGGAYEKFITALAFDSKNPKYQLRAKYNMVPFSERAPLGLNVLTTGLRTFTGKFDNVTHFSDMPNKKNAFAIDEKVNPLSLLCYETIFPLTAALGVNEGANVIFIHANEEWFQPEISGAEQTFYYSAIRAIENRRFVARSTNGGVTGFIDPAGKILQSTQSDHITHLNQAIQLNGNLTFFSKFGHYLYLLIPFCLLLSLVVLIIPESILLPYNPWPLSPKT